jgi:hypothetical protein
MSYGPGDTYSPPSTIQTMAAAAGLQLAPPVVEDLGIGSVSRPVGANRIGGDGVPRLGAIFQYMPNGYDGHFVAFRDAAARADWTAFLVSLIASGTPSVP